MRRPFSPWVDCLLWLLAGWLAGLTVTLAGVALEWALRPGPWFRRLLTIAPNVIGIGAVLVLGLSGARQPPGAILFLRRPPWKALPWVALTSFCLALLTAALNTWIDRILPMPQRVVNLFQQVLEYHTLSQFLGVLFFLVVVAPVTEELMFRGLFLHRLSEGYGPRRAILGSALCFGIFHILPWQAIGAALVGVYLGWLVVRTGSIILPVAAHALFNLVPVAATGLAHRFPALRGLGADAEMTEFHVTPSLLLGAALAMSAGILGTIRATRSGGEFPPAGPDPGPASLCRP